MDTESQACDQCYRTKQTCSKSLPRCQRCVDASNPCTYSFGKFMGKPKRSSKIRRESSNNEMENNSNGGKFFGLLNLKKAAPEYQREPSVTDIASSSPAQSVWTSSSWDIMPEGLSSDHSSPSNPTSPTRPRTHSTASGTSNRLMATPACDQCYRFKVKCSRDPDCCRRCANNRSVCTYSAAAPLPVGKSESIPKVEEHKKKKARQVQIDDPSVLSTDLRGTSVDSRSYSFTDSPTSQQAELHVDDLNNFYGFDIPAIGNIQYTFAPVSVPPTPATWVTNQPTLYDLDSTVGLNNGTETFPFSWQNPEIQPSPFFANGVPLQKFPPTSVPLMNQLPTPTSPAFPPENVQTANCDCFSNALSVLNDLNACVQERNPLHVPGHPELVSQFQTRVFNTTTNALETCESSTQCICAHNSMVSMLHAIILQQISTCHEMLSSSSFHDHCQRPWLSNERARGMNICDEMELRLRNTYDEVEDQSEVLGRNSVIGLLSSVRTKFSEEVLGMQ